MSGSEKEPDDRSGGWLWGIIGILAAVLSGSGMAAIAESRLAIAGVGAFVFTVTITFLPPGRRRGPLLLKRRGADAELDEVHGGAHERGRLLRSEVQRRWQEGALAHPDAFDVAKQKLLQTVINIHARRVSHGCGAPITLAVVEDTRDEFVARRASEDSLGDRVVRGMRCANDGPLKGVARHYAKFSLPMEFHACGQKYYLVGLSDKFESLETSKRAKRLLEEATNEYESTYQLLRWMALSSPGVAQ